MENGKNLFLNALNFRHACKVFDKERKISDEDVGFLLECGRLSPTSFGLEQFRFLIVESQAKREELKRACWDQDQITSASLVVAIKCKIEDMRANSPYVISQLKRKAKEEEFLNAYLQKYAGFLEGKNIACWSEKQAYLAAANMMNGAAFIGIDSCPIEGFEKECAEGVLEIDSRLESLSLIVTFGYRAGQQSQRFRLDKNEYVETI